jgi:hypothetical protein
MRRLIASTFASLDGIMQAPGGPEEDLTGGLALGGWMFRCGDDGTDISAAGVDGKDRDLVPGRGKRHFSEATRPSTLRLVGAQVSTTGVVMGTSAPGGDIQPGWFPSADPSDKELARRRTLANGAW